MNNVKEFTDIYFIAALLSYGWTLSSSDRKNPNKQKFYFQSEIRPVFVIEGNEAYSKDVDLDELRNLYMSKRVLLLGTYPDVLKPLKQDIISYRHNDKE